MKPKDRFLGAIHRQPVDRIPLFDFLFQRPLYTEIIGRTPDSFNARDAMDLTKALGLDGVWIPFGAFAGWTPEELSDKVYKDEWGTTFEKSAASWPIDPPIAYPLTTSADLASYIPPDPWSEGRLAEIDTAVDMNNSLGDEAVAICGGVAGPLTTAWMLTGYENICTSLYDDPGFLHDIAQIAVDYSKAAATQMAQAGVDIMVVSEDLGSSTSGLISPKHYKQIFKPALGEIVSHVKNEGLPVLVHSCGHIYDFLDDLVELGIDAIHPLQRTAGMYLGRVKAEYGDKLCIVGNIDSSRTLPYGTPADVDAEVKDAIETAAPGWGYILASDHSLHDGISVENIKAMLDAGRKYGKY